MALWCESFERAEYSVPTTLACRSASSSLPPREMSATTRHASMNLARSSQSHAAPLELSHICADLMR